MTKKYIAAAMCAAIALATGCAARDGDSEMPQETAHKSENRTLVGVEYEVVNGMVYGADFSAVIERDKIVAARYFSLDEYEKEPTDDEPYPDGYVTVEGAEITEEQWSALEEAVTEIVPILEEVSDKSFDMLPEFIEETDGPNYRKFYLMWENENGEKERVEYYPPNDGRFDTTISLMEEIVNPVGREINCFDEPSIGGAIKKG